MRWEDEHYVKLYTRDTPTWKALGWQARCLLPLLMRVVDKAGLLECGELGRAAVSLMVNIPEEVASAGLSDLERRGIVAYHDGTLEMPKFEEAQEARKSDILRKREERQRARDKARAKTRVTPQGVSHGVTPRPEVSQPVTLQPVPDPVPSPVLTAPPSEEQPAKAKAADPRHHPLKLRLTETYRRMKRSEYGYEPNDTKAVVRLLKLCASDDEIVRRWELALALSAFPGCAKLSLFAARWNDLAGKATGPPVRDASRGMVRAQDVDKAAYAQVGVVNDW